MQEIDKTLLRAIERGEQAVLETLARHYAPPVYRFLVRLCADATLAEDLAQEVALQLWRSLPGRRFPNARALNAWVYTVAANAFRMHCRKRRVSEVSWEAHLELPASEECDPAATAERQELAHHVRRAVCALPEAEREALLLKVFADMRYEEISQSTGDPVGTIKWRVSRAYAMLRHLLLPDGTPAEKAREQDEPLRKVGETPERQEKPGAALAHAAPPARVPRLFGAKGR